MEDKPAMLGGNDERERLKRFVASAWPRVLLIEGEAGNGKTTLWRFGMGAAAREGCRVLAFRVGETERSLTFAGLTGLLPYAMLDEVLPNVPEPRRRVLETALLRSDKPDTPADPRAVGLALVSALTALAERGPLLLAVDDRRERVVVGGLSVGALARLVHVRLAMSFPRLVSVRLHQRLSGEPVRRVGAGARRRGPRIAPGAERAVPRSGRRRRPRRRPVRPPVARRQGCSPGDLPGGAPHRGARGGRHRWDEATAQALDAAAEQARRGGRPRRSPRARPAPLRARDLKALERRRMRAAKLVEEGATQAEVVRRLGVSRTTASRWFAKWQQGGTDALRTEGRRGRKTRLTDGELRRVEEALLKGARAHGFGTDLWTLERVGEVIRGQTGKRCHPGHVGRILRRMGWSLQRPAREASERDEKAIASRSSGSSEARATSTS